MYVFFKFHHSATRYAGARVSARAEVPVLRLDPGAGRDGDHGPGGEGGGRSPGLQWRQLLDQGVPVRITIDTCIQLLCLLTITDHMYSQTNSYILIIYSIF